MGELRTASLTGSKPGIWDACWSDSSPSSAAASEPVETPLVATGQCPPTVSFFGLSAPFIRRRALARALCALDRLFLSTTGRQTRQDARRSHLIRLRTISSVRHNLPQPPKSPCRGPAPSFIIPLLSFSLPFLLVFSVIILDPLLIIFSSNVLPRRSLFPVIRVLLWSSLTPTSRILHTRA